MYMRQTDAKFVSRTYKTSKANLPDTVAGSRLSTYSSVGESFAGWLTTGFPSLAITRSPPSFPGSDSYCCLLRAILVNNSCKRVRPVYSPVTPRSIEFASARSFHDPGDESSYFRTLMDAYRTRTNVHGTIECKDDILRA